jgi:hypothetical protein
MAETISTIKQNSFSKRTSIPNQKSQKLIAKTWENNTQSDYTEIIKKLGQNFSFSSNKDCYWSDPELSLLYGTPLYSKASLSQKIALNHLYWLKLYQGVTATEIGAILYNQIAGSLFEKIGGYATLCQELELETAQEKIHIAAFQKVCSKLKLALLGRTFMGHSQFHKLQQQTPRSTVGVPEKALRLLTKIMLRDYSNYYSPYLQKLEQKGYLSQVPTYGVSSQVGSVAQLKFFTLNIGSSPFLACQAFTIRFAANILLKAQELCYSKHFLKLDRQSTPIPAPTAISRHHFLDESFHTIISQTLAKEFYKNFPKPNTYEKFIANWMFYNMQTSLLGGLSGVLPGRCIQDNVEFMYFFYKVLRSSLFGMSEIEALEWMEKCFCHEHEGFHVTLKYQRRLLAEFRQVFATVEYLSPTNRELRLMAARGSIDAAIRDNIKTFKHFSRTITKKGR